jgi:ABC-type Na+ efflux pump permease subunit
MINNGNHYSYWLTILFSAIGSPHFLMNSILSDKRNQTFERYFVSGNIKTIMFAKLSAMSIFSIIPFIIFYTYFLFNGINIIDNIFIAFNTPQFFWILLCLMTIFTFIFNDENSVSFAGIPCILFATGLIFLNNFIATNYHPILTCIVTIICTVIVTVVAYKVYKKTKYFLKI